MRSFVGIIDEEQASTFNSTMSDFGKLAKGHADNAMGNAKERLGQAVGNDNLRQAGADQRARGNLDMGKASGQAQSARQSARQPGKPQSSGLRDSNQDTMTE
ncbi:hypothetical protein GQ54DRAFT_311500 [Martensiomyces pterosporus]|nr:hypothetical protein GQ54DRAFT_311500 [Martensiomyces pterosporus]